MWHDTQPADHRKGSERRAVRLKYLAYRFRDGTDERLLLRAFEHGPKIDLDAPDLADPIGRELAFYREQALLIRSCVESLALFVKHRR